MALFSVKGFDHNRLIAHMSGSEVLAEYLYLNSGKAEVEERRGVKLGLPPPLEARREHLKIHIEHCIQEYHTAEV